MVQWTVIKNKEFFFYPYFLTIYLLPFAIYKYKI